MDKKEVLAHTIDCKEKQLSFFDKETIEPLCKVQILENTATGDIDWGWQRRNPEEIFGLVVKCFEFDACNVCGTWEQTRSLEKEPCKSCYYSGNHFENGWTPNEYILGLKKKFIEELMKDEL